MPFPGCARSWPVNAAPRRGITVVVGLCPGRPAHLQPAQPKPLPSHARRLLDGGAYGRLSPSPLPIAADLLLGSPLTSRRACNPGLPACFCVVLGTRARRERPGFLRSIPARRLPGAPPRPIIPTCRGWIALSPEAATLNPSVNRCRCAAGDRNHGRNRADSQRPFMLHRQALGSSPAGHPPPVALDPPHFGRQSGGPSKRFLPSLKLSKSIRGKSHHRAG